MGLGLQPLSTSQNTQIRIAGSVQREAKTTGRKLKFLTQILDLIILPVELPYYFESKMSIRKSHIF